MAEKWFGNLRARISEHYYILGVLTSVPCAPVSGTRILGMDGSLRRNGELNFHWKD